MKRNNSTIELLRIFLLFFLISYHWSHFIIPNFLDTHIVNSISSVSVTAFALITGIFVFEKKSFLFKNISRLIFIIIFSIIIGYSVFTSLGMDVSKNLTSIFTGSRDSWYLYAILPLYLFGPILAKYLNKLKWFAPALIGIFIIIITSWIGSPFSAYYLIAVALIGNTISRFDTTRKKANILSLSLFTITIISIVLINIFINNWGAQQGSPTAILLAISMVVFAKFNVFYSKKLNWLVKRLYFVYEYHWYWQTLWYTLFTGFIKTHPHLEVYVNWIGIFLFGSVMSMLITEIQLRVWNRYVDPQMLKIVDWTKLKLIKQKTTT